MISCLSDVNVKALSAFGTRAAMIPLDTAKLDLHTAMRTFTIYVSLAVFPFVSLQKYLFLDSFPNLQVTRIFLRSGRKIAGKHTKEDTNTKHERNPLQSKI